MFDQYLDNYILKMDSLKFIQETIEKDVPNRINKDVSKYKDAILMDLYFNQILSGKDDKQLEKHVKKYIEVTELDKKEKKIAYKYKKIGDSLTKYKNIEESRKAMNKGIYTIKTMYNNLLISIMIEFENIISQIFYNIIVKYPNAYLSDTKVDYVDVIKSKDIKDIKESIVNNHVDTIMRENIFKWFKLWEDKHKVKISLENNYIIDFIEAYLRRNIIVHNNSKINNDYINGMNRIGKAIPYINIGREVICTKKYIDRVIDASIYCLIYIMNQMLILFNDKNDSFAEKILEMAYDMINSGEYELSREICRLLKDNKKINQQIRIYSLINYWQTFKWDNKYEEIEDEINEFDTSAYEEIIKLAVYALRENYNEIYEILNIEFCDDKQNNELAFELEEYPVFKKLRKQKKYKEFKDRYPQAFSIKSTSIDVENENERKDIIKKDKGNFKITINIVDENDKPKIH